MQPVKPYQQSGLLREVSVYGKIPPQVTEIEQAVLGACLIDKEAFSKCSEILTEECFYSGANRSVFKAITDVNFSGRPVDILTVSEQLRGCNNLESVGGKQYVASLTNSVVSSGNIEAHSRLVLESYMKREVIRISGELLNDGYTDGTDAFWLLEKAEEAMAKIRLKTDQRSYKPLTTVLVDTFKHLEAIRHRTDHLTGVTSGFLELDRVTCGWQETDLIILAARPGVGKTAFALNLAVNAKCPVGFFSLEMSERQLAQRALSSESGILLWNLRNGKMDDEQMKSLYSRGVQPMASKVIFIDDSANIKLSELKAKARRMVTRDGVKIIFIDYLQLITVGQQFSRKDLEIGYISSQLKGLAKDLNIPVVCLSQLSRSVEQRGVNEPKLSDLRESGAIEQDADLVLFLWRPSESEVLDNPELNQYCNIKIEKHRNGTLEKFLGKFSKEIQKWEYLKCLDGSGMPVGGNWKPVSNY